MHQWRLCLLWLSFVVLAGVRAASITKKDIPVRVLYENSGHQHDQASVRNLDETIQLSPDELKQSEKANTGVRNLDAKVQLSQEDLSLATKHLPLPPEEWEKNEVPHQPTLKIVTPDDFPSVPLEQKKTDNADDDKLLLQRIQEIIGSGVERIKNAADAKAVKPEVWKKLDRDVEAFLATVQQKNSLRQSQNQTQNPFQNLAQQFQNFADNFMSQFGNQNQDQNQQSDETSEQGGGGFGQNIVNLFTNGFQQIQSGLSSLGGQQNAHNGTVLGDTEATARPPNNPFQGFVQGVQGVFSGQTNPIDAIGNLNPFNQPATTQAPGVQGDEATTAAANPIQSIQNAFSNFGQQIAQFNPFNQASTQAPGSQGDEPTTQGGPFQFVQGIGQVFNQFNPFNPPSTAATAAPPVQGDPTTKNPFQAAAENVGNQISQGVSGFAPPVGNNPLQGLTEQVQGVVGANNPFQGGGNPIQGIAEQVGSAVSSNNPLQGGSNPVQGLIDQASANNPLQGGSNPVQGLVNQVTANNPLQGAGNPVQGLIDQASANNPLQGGSNPVQGLVNQVSANNPLQGGNNPLQGLIDQASANNPLQGGSNPVQGLVNQVSANNPLQGGNNPVQGLIDQASANNPLQGGNNPVQGLVNQVSASNPLQGAQGLIDQASSNNPVQGLVNQVGANNPLQVGNPVESGGQALQGLVNQVTGGSGAREESVGSCHLFKADDEVKNRNQELAKDVPQEVDDRKKAEEDLGARFNAVAADEEQEKQVSELLVASD